MVDRGANRGGPSNDMVRLPSLMWPPDTSRQGTRLSPQAGADLDIEPVVQALSGRQAHRVRFVTEALTQPPTDPAIIAYRAEVLTNLLDKPELRARLEGLLPLLDRVIRERQRP